VVSRLLYTRSLNARMDSRFAVLLRAMIGLIGGSIGANLAFLQMYLREAAVAFVGFSPASSSAATARSMAWHTPGWGIDRTRRTSLRRRSTWPSRDCAHCGIRRPSPPGSGGLRRISAGCSVRSAPGIAALDGPISAGYAEVASSSPCPIEELEHKQMRCAIRTALDRLPEAMGRTADLFYLETLSLRQVSALLDVPISTVKIRLFRARERIRRDGLGPLLDVYTPTAKEKIVNITPAAGILHIHRAGYGFLRPTAEAASATTDVYVSASQIHRFELAEGARVATLVRRRVASPTTPC
jgi:RNA polymerase sigma factor (sigma-70 family)